MNEEKIRLYYERIEKLLNGANKETYGFVPEEIRQLLKWYETLQQENQQLKERPYYKFYRYENNPNGSDYCFCQRPCNSNMSLLCFLENGEILGFMSESLVYKHNEIKEVDLNEITHNFVKPLIKEKQHYKHIIDELEKDNNRLLELCMYALISSTKIYNHELAADTKQAFIDIIKNNLNNDTHTLREKIQFQWDHM